MTPFYESLAAPTPADEGPILVAQADGKGVPMLPEDQVKEPKVRLGKGEKHGKKKEAIVTAVYTADPRVRTAEEVTESLFRLRRKRPVRLKRRRSADAKRAGPRNKRLSATLNGKSAAIQSLAKQVAKREGDHIRARVALTDGAEPLQRLIIEFLVGFTLILDIIHAVEYLWKVANCLMGEKSTKRDDWVKNRVLRMLAGDTQSVITEFLELAEAPRTRKGARSVLRQVAGYYERNLPYMRYNEYLSAGWPIATGVSEGACRHVVKDRCELAGMHWTQVRR